MSPQVVASSISLLDQLDRKQPGVPSIPSVTTSARTKAERDTASRQVADIFRRHGAAYRASRRLPLHQLRVMRAIETCRTAALGGHVEQCGHCSHIRTSYNSCRNRHCPKCQSLARARC